MDFNLFAQKYKCQYAALREQKNPVLLYGTGDGAEKINALLSARGIKISGIIASRGFARGQSFLNRRVLEIGQAERAFGEFTAVLCFALEGDKAEFLSGFQKKHKLYSPNLPVYGGGVFDKEYIIANAEKIAKVYSLFNDKLSRELFLSLIKYNITGKIKYLYENENTFSLPEKFFIHNARHIDAGAFDGDTVFEFSAKNNNYSDITAFEPDKRNYAKLVKNTKTLRDIICVNAALSDKQGEAGFENRGGRAQSADFDGRGTEALTIDNYCGMPRINSGGVKVGSIKIDAEGHDLEVLQGAANVIYAFKPDIMAAVYHRLGDLLDIPLFLHKHNAKYKFALRKKPYVPAWDVFICAGEK